MTIELDRKTYIGGSDVAAILGVSPWKSAFRLYQEKIGEYQEEITQAKKKIFSRGKRWEPVVIEMLVDELEDRGHNVEILARNERYKHGEIDYIAAEIDLELRVDGIEVNGEMKTVHPFAAKDWGDENTDEIPVYYTAQCLHGQMVTGRNKTVVAALIGADDLRVHFVDRDEEMINIIKQREIEFWDMVQNRRAPDPVTLDDINWLYKIGNDSVCDADDDIFSLYQALVNLKADAKRNESDIEVIAAKIKSYMGSSSVLTHNGAALLTWKNNKDSQKTDWKSAFHGLAEDYAKVSSDDLQEYVRKATKTVSGSRVFRIK